MNPGLSAGIFLLVRIDTRMGNYASSRATESKSQPVIDYLSRGGTVEYINDIEGQYRDGDIRWNGKNIELKCEEKHTGNLYLETWSNRKWRNRGWAYKLGNRDAVIYYFADRGVAYLIDAEKLGQWLKEYDDTTPYYSRPERQQRKCEQANDTWGYLIPVDRLTEAGVIRTKLNLSTLN